MRIGVDTGGTFTDFVRLDRSGLRVHKVRTTSDEPHRGILEGLAFFEASQPGVAVVHGSTVATNAVLERKGARLAGVFTAGFEDLLSIGRQTRRELYNFDVEAPAPLVDRALTFGVRERIGADGEVLVALQPQELDRLAGAVRQTRCEAVVVCLLHAYAYPDHERRIAERLRADGLTVCASHEILPEYREFERASTTALNAYVTPLVARYLGQLEGALRERPLAIMQSNGGTISAAAARAHAVRTVLSGPAAGVVGAEYLSRAAGFPRAISFDMGGTSTDVSLIDGGIGVTAESGIGDFPLRLPVLDIHTVGAGGGSLARVDSGGALRVGPESAGSAPGPACYGRGDLFTVTDANLMLGRLDPDAFFGGRMRLDAARARRAAMPLARELGRSVEATADGVIRVANANMERAIRVVSLERGYDPRRFALVAFGGAGGMHACDIAAELGIRTVLVPRHAGVLSALGMLVADVTRDYATSILRPASEMGDRDLRRVFTPLLDLASRALQKEGFPKEARRVRMLLDLRYLGQSYEITVPWSTRAVAEFHRAHRRKYGYADEERPVEMVAARVQASGAVRKPPLRVGPARRHEPPAASLRPAWFAGVLTRTRLYRWEQLAPGARGPGPSVITAPEATAVVPPRWAWQLDQFGNLIVTAAAARARR